MSIDKHIFINTNNFIESWVHYLQIFSENLQHKISMCGVNKVAIILLLPHLNSDEVIHTSSIFPLNEILVMKQLFYNFIRIATELVIPRVQCHDSNWNSPKKELTENWIFSVHERSMRNSRSANHDSLCLSFIISMIISKSVYNILELFVPCSDYFLLLSSSHK